MSLKTCLAACSAAIIAGVMMPGVPSTAFAQVKPKIGKESGSASQHPPLTPMRDAEVTYAVQPKKFPKPLDVTVSFKAGGDYMRVDGPQHIATTIFNRKDHFVTLILHQQKLYNRFSPKVGLRNPFMLDLSMAFTPQGQANVAGLTCTRWAISSRYGAATACVTDDGIILSEEGVDADGVNGKLVAKQVSYRELPGSVFDVPAGYSALPVKSDKDKH